MLFLKDRYEYYQLKKNIRGVLFDVDGTMYHQAPLRIIMIFLILLNHLFVPIILIRNLKIIRIFRHAQELLRKEDRYLFRPLIEQIRLTSNSTGIPENVISEVVQEWFFDKPKLYIPFFKRGGIKKTLKWLNKKGFKLGVFSDYPSSEKLKALDIADFFDVIIDADDQNLRGFKPHTNGYILAAETMGLDPSEILYVGDRPDVDAEGALKNGMHSVIIGSVPQKKNTLSFLKIKSFLQLKELLLQ